ncbi:uncharacterized protein LOC126055215 [Helicoverpa armigera]|uniref:uncharacterized protein LOC126055215 n=1 Tax=Helicoverpa armigera TaxID=29058 RepID=UPI00308318E3
MWAPTVSLYLLIFYGYTSSQPVTDDSENARQTRQLDFVECCPCPGTGQDYDVQETTFRGADGSLTRALDDCPCRQRTADNEGASSIFFPTSVRSDGSSIRPTDKKEELKPLLHPEVDLASSVLQTLREATDEEYREALARDAARSMARAAEETIFGDAVPEASNGNVVTIIVKPKQTNSLDDILPQESHNQESRCIHAPLESSRTNLGKMRLAKKPNLLREMFGLPTISKPARLLHRDVLDMDSGMRASNVQEQVVPIDGNTLIGKTNMLSNLDEHDSLIKGFKLPSMKNKLKDFLSNRSPLEATKINTSPLPPIPKLKLNNSLSKAKGTNIEDLSLSPSNIEEQAKLSLLKAKSHLESIFQKPKQDGLKNLFKLKDVELVPLKDLFNKPSDNSLPLPSIFKKSGKMTSADEDENLERSQSTGQQGVKNNGEILDHDVSPSNIIENKSDPNCFVPNDSFKTATSENGRIENLNDKSSSAEELASNPEVTTSSVDVGRDTESNELGYLDNDDDCNVKTIPVTELNIPKSIENVMDDEAQNTSGDELNSDISQEQIPESTNNEETENSEFASNDGDDCINQFKDADSSGDSSNNINNFVKPDDTNRENFETVLNNNELIKEPCSQERQATFETVDTTASEDSPQKPLIKPLSLDQTLSTIKENIIKTIENLKIPKPNPKTANIFNLPIPSTDTENRESSPVTDEKVNPDCTNEESIPVTTSKPVDDSCIDNLENNNDSPGKISMQDLQKISDEMLQREEEQRKAKTLDCNEPSQEVTDANVDEDPTITTNQSEIDNMDAEPSANTQNEVVTDPQNLDEIGDNIVNSKENTCVSELMLPKQTADQNTDANADASEITDIIVSPLSLGNVFEPKVNVFDILDNPIPEIQGGFKLPPLPTLDDIKLKLTDVFDNTPREVEECSVSPTQAEPMTDPLNILTPVMQTDASAPKFQLRNPLEDFNLDILQLNPQKSLIPKLPKIDLPLHKTKLQLPELSLKPINLKSPLEDLSLGRNNLWPNIPDNQWEMVPDLKDLGNRVKTNAQKINKSRKPPALRNSFSTKPRIGDFTGDIHSQAKHTLRSMHQSLESKFREATKPVKLQPDELLETISRNHEDMSDKLKALHIDFNDRIETMRNNLFEKSRFANSGSRSKTFTTFSTQNKDKPFSLKATQPKSQAGRREQKKSLKTNRLDQPRSSGIGSSQRLSNQKKFKMPAAASVPVPRTIEVPRLQASLTKLPGPAVQRTSDIIPGTRNIAPLDKEPATLWKQTSRKYITNPRLGKQINPFKDSKINISFSTTPRPMLESRKHDFKGSPSEINKSVISAPTSRQLKNFDNQNRDSEAKRPSQAFERSSSKLVSGREKDANVPSLSKDLQSWPKPSEGAFLTKVKEAVKARMSKVNSPERLKQGIVSSGDKNVLNSNTDMARAASENVDAIEGKVLKENVSYKCKLLCTKE